MSAIAGLAIIGQVWIQQALNQQSLDIQVISAAQQQQISSQRLVKSILALKLPATSEEQRERAQELEAAIQAAEASLQTLADIQNSTALPTRRRQQVEQMVTQLSPQYETLIETARDNLETNASDSPVSRLQQRRQPIRSLAPLLAADQAFVNNMDGLILEYNQRVAAETQRLKRLELSLLLVTLTVLVLEGFVVFRPAVRKIQQMMTALDQSLQKTRKTARHLAIEQQKSEKLLLNILPQPIAQRLKQKSEAIADGFSDVTVLFADIVGFTQLSTTMLPQKLVSLLNGIFSAFDQLCEKHDLEKIKTIGDPYMVVGGLPVAREDHAKAVVDFALDMQRAIATFNQDTRESFRIRIGINSGPVVAGVIGTKKFIYDLWGDTVNIVSRMESHGTPGSIQITESTFQQVKDHFQIEALGKIAVKGKGEMITYRVIKSL
ncbi:MAG: adenylate/guanylate cyclase domain-containing protein [Elainellaceae cyanobacterium]